MDFFIYLMAGAFIGWVANQILGHSRQKSAMFNVVVSVLGVFITGLFILPLLGIDAISEANFSLPALFISVGGAVFLLVVINLFGRGPLRKQS